jgi:hypothetical protein
VQRVSRQGRPPSLSGKELQSHDRIFRRRFSRPARSRCALKSAAGDSSFAKRYGAAQQASPSLSPPNVLQTFVESVKPGKGAAHEKVEIG